MDYSDTNFDQAIMSTELLPKHFNLLYEHLTFAYIYAEAVRNETVSWLITEHLSVVTELLSTIDTQLQGTLVNQIEARNENPVLDNALSKLTQREQEILRLIVNGSSNTEIATTLSLAESTIRVYRSRIMSKLQIAEITSLVKFAISHDLTTC